MLVCKCVGKCVGEYGKELYVYAVVNAGPSVDHHEHMSVLATSSCLLACVRVYRPYTPALPATCV